VRAAGQNAFVLPKLRIDVVVQDESAGPVADAIARSVNTGAIGDGKVWICPAGAEEVACSSRTAGPRSPSR
jgi:nitrogen regulatory protein P-II 1